MNMDFLQKCVVEDKVSPVKVLRLVLKDPSLGVIITLLTTSEDGDPLKNVYENVCLLKKTFEGKEDVLDFFLGGLESVYREAAAETESQKITSTIFESNKKLNVAMGICEAVEGILEYLDLFLDRHTNDIIEAFDGKLSSYMCNKDIVFEILCRFLDTMFTESKFKTTACRGFVFLDIEDTEDSYFRTVTILENSYGMKVRVSRIDDLVHVESFLPTEALIPNNLDRSGMNTESGAKVLPLNLTDFSDTPNRKVELLGSTDSALLKIKVKASLTSICYCELRITRPEGTEIQKFKVLPPTGKRSREDSALYALYYISMNIIPDISILKIEHTFSRNILGCSEKGTLLGSLDIAISMRIPFLTETFRKLHIIKKEYVERHIFPRNLKHDRSILDSCYVTLNGGKYFVTPHVLTRFIERTAKYFGTFNCNSLKALREITDQNTWEALGDDKIEEYDLPEAHNNLTLVGSDSSDYAFLVNTKGHSIITILIKSHGKNTDYLEHDVILPQLLEKTI